MGQDSNELEVHRRPDYKELVIERRGKKSLNELIGRMDGESSTVKISGVRAGINCTVDCKFDNHLVLVMFRVTPVIRIERMTGVLCVLRAVRRATLAGHARSVQDQSFAENANDML